MPQLPVEVDDLTPAWMSDAMDTDVTSVTVLDRHSGTTGRAHLALAGDPRLPATVFVKLAPFDERQRKFVNVQGMGVVEARLYRDLAHELPVRVPGVWYAEFDGVRAEGLCLTTLLHPKVSGKPGRILLLDELLRYLRAPGDVWFGTCREVAEWWRATHPKLAPASLGSA